MSSPLLMSASVLFMFVVYVHVLSSVAVNVSERGKYMVQILLILQCNADILIAPSSVPCCPPPPWSSSPLLSPSSPPLPTRSRFLLPLLPPTPSPGMQQYHLIYLYLFI